MTDAESDSKVEQLRAANKDLEIQVGSLEEETKTLKHRVEVLEGGPSNLNQSKPHPIYFRHPSALYQLLSLLVLGSLWSLPFGYSVVVRMLEIQTISRILQQSHDYQAVHCLLAFLVQDP